MQKLCADITLGSIRYSVVRADPVKLALLQPRLNRFELLQLTTQTLLNSQNAFAAALQLEQSAHCIAAAAQSCSTLRREPHRCTKPPILGCQPAGRDVTVQRQLSAGQAVKVSELYIYLTMVPAMSAVSRTQFGDSDTTSLRYATTSIVAVFERESTLYSSIGLQSIQVESVDDIAKADRLVFPGVGSYGQAMERLKHLGYTQALKDYIQVKQHGFISHLHLDAANLSEANMCFHAVRQTISGNLSWAATAV